MSTQTFACPACGSRKAIDDPRPGEKIHCTCGMSFPASPVFAVADAGGKKMSGTGWAFAASVALLIGCAGAAAWLMTRTTAGQPDRSGRQVAVVPNTSTDSGRASAPVEPRPDPASERPTTTRPDPETPAATPANPPPTPENPPVKPAPAPRPPPPPAPAETLTAVKLWDAFDLDEDAAKARYVGKVLEVSGRGRVARNSLGRPYFGMEVVSPRPAGYSRSGPAAAKLTPAERRWEKEGYPPSVRCYLTADQEAALEKLSPGQPVVLRGTCVGRKNMEDVYRGYIVELDNCVVVTPK